MSTLQTMETETQICKRAGYRLIVGTITVASAYEEVACSNQIPSEAELGYRWGCGRAMWRCCWTGAMV
jgi:hypothetical protein